MENLVQKLLQIVDEWMTMTHKFVSGAHVPPERAIWLENERVRLIALVKRAVDAGWAMESAYETGFHRFHNINDWEAEDRDRVQTVRNSLGECLDELMSS